MQVNCILIIFLSLIILCFSFKKRVLESLNDNFSMVGNGCCSFDDSDPIPMEAQNADQCLNICQNDESCLAVDVTETNDKLKCMIYHGKKPLGTIHTSCHDEPAKCYRKNSQNSQNLQCPYHFKIIKKPPYNYDDEILVDHNTSELSILDKITSSLKEIIKLESKPSGCNDGNMNTCRPGTLTSNELVDWLKTEENINNQTCNEANANDKCAKTVNNIASLLTERPPSDSLTHSERPPSDSLTHSHSKHASPDLLTHSDHAPPNFLTYSHSKYTAPQKRPTLGSAGGELSTPAINHSHSVEHDNIPDESSYFEPLFSSV